MVDENQIGETIATNLVPDPRLTRVLPGGVNVVQSVMSGGMGVSLERGAGDGEAYATPWVDAGSAAGDKVCVLIVSSNTLQPPAGGVSLDDGGDGNGLVWLRGASTGYAEVMAVRCADPAACRLHAPASGVLTIVKSGVFDLDSWGAMQERGIIYFDGGGIIQASESGYTLPPATASTLGGVIVGDGLQVTPQGVLSVIPQDLPIATQDTAGVVKAGNGVRVKSDGTLEIRLGKNLSFDESGKGGGFDKDNYYTKAESDDRYLVAEAPYEGNVGSCTIVVDSNVVTLTLYGVTLTGATTSISGSVPSAYRPKKEIAFACGTNEGKAARGYVSTGGSISVTQLGGATGTSAFGSASWGVER